MSFQLTKADYIKILKYYNLEIPKNIKDIKKSAEHILAKKLCSGIKKVSPDTEPNSIGICTRTIFNRKHLTRGKFNCIGTRKVEFIKNIKKINISRKNKKK